jgi:hypothetical protein
LCSPHFALVQHNPLDLQISPRRRPRGQRAPVMSLALRSFKLGAPSSTVMQKDGLTMLYARSRHLVVCKGNESKECRHCPCLRVRTPADLGMPRQEGVRQYRAHPALSVARATWLQ